VTGESELSSSDLWVTVKTRPSSSTSRDRLIKYAEERFKTPIHSLSQIDRSSGVNRLRLTIHGNETSPIANYTLCDNEAFMTSQPSPIVEAWRTGETQPTEGCFHSDHAGTYSKYKLIKIFVPSTLKLNRVPFVFLQRCSRHRVG